jgi:ferredoxin
MSQAKKVTITNHEGATFEVSAYKSILDAGRDAGLPLPYACGVGNCTTCVARVVEGVVATPQGGILTDRQIDAGLVLLCVATPLSDCTLEIGLGGV